MLQKTRWRIFKNIKKGCSHEKAGECALFSGSARSCSNDGGGVSLSSSLYAFESRSTFAPDAITIDTEKPLWLNLRNTIFHHADFAQIQTLLEDYHRTYFSSLASGSWRLFGRAHFTEDGIYEEANARTLYQMFACAGDGEAVGEGDFHYTYDLCRISGDLCKVVLTRHAEVATPTAFSTTAIQR